MDKNACFRNIPKVDVLLEDPAIIALCDEYGRDIAVDCIRSCTDDLRAFIGKSDDMAEIQRRTDSLVQDIRRAAEALFTPDLRPVINGTGTVLHTNLGRAPISRAHSERMQALVSGYSNLEYDLEAGKRGERYSHFEKLLCRITGAEAAMAVNNNAAAVFLVLSALGVGKEIPVSRGELVEIGGKFRVPDVMAQSGAIMVEVGTTNKTHPSDYENVINENTGALLKVHTSNFRIVGFTESADIKELCELGAKHDIPVIEDIGSGVLIDLSKYGLPYEPTVQESLRAGASIVCFSGDKLLGGGVILRTDNKIRVIAGNADKRINVLDVNTRIGCIADDLCHTAGNVGHFNGNYLGDGNEMSSILKRGLCLGSIAYYHTENAEIGRISDGKSADIHTAFRNKLGNSGKLAAAVFYKNGNLTDCHNISSYLS